MQKNLTLNDYDITWSMWLKNIIIVIDLNKKCEVWMRSNNTSIIITRQKISRDVLTLLACSVASILTSCLELSPYVEFFFTNGNCAMNTCYCDLSNLPCSWVHNELLWPKVTDLCKLFRVIIVLIWALCIMWPSIAEMAKLVSPNCVMDKELDNLWQ